MTVKIQNVEGQPELGLQFLSDLHAYFTKLQFIKLPLSPAEDKLQDI